MSWQLVARIRTRATGLHPAEMWHDVSVWNGKPLLLGGNVHCSCGGAVTDRGELGYDDGGCSHLVALYAGRVTEDPTVSSGAPEDSMVYEVLGIDHTKPWLVQLTELGSQMFRWRWAQRALERSS